MNTQNHKINIVGAGVSGLVAAIVLEQHGYHPTIIEATDTVGGRVKTDVVAGYRLDHGFQVLLTAYPAVKTYLDLKALDLQYFLPGASIFKPGKQHTIGDPLRSLALLIPTLKANIGSFKDKLNILKLNKTLKNKSLEAIFKTEETTTLNYLKNLGFTPAIIEDFFRPFFSGIFLENKLDTSSRMFEFIYKMFGEGYATLPKEGIGAIPQQLKAKLKQTKFMFNSKATAITNNNITLEDNTVLNNDFTIVATDAAALISNLKEQPNSWQSCKTLYFETETPVINTQLIGLIPHKNSIINNLYYHTNTKNKNLLSVTLVKPISLNQEALIERVKTDLATYCNISTLRFIKQYSIPKALPKLNNLTYELSPSETQLTPSIFLAGDTLLNGSLNAAMIAGERAALGVIEAITNTKT